MTEPVEDQNNNEQENKDKVITTDSADTPANATAQGMNRQAIEDNSAEKEDDKEGEGTGGRGGRRGGGGGGGIRLPPNKLKDVVGVWKHLDLAEAVARVAEFFSEVPARASANISVSWEGIKKHGFALVNHFISSGSEIAMLMRSKDAGFIKRLRTKYGVNARQQKLPANMPGMGPMPS